MAETKFNISQKTQEDIKILYIRGYLDAHTAPDLENTIASMVSNGDLRIIVNFRDLDYISSAGLGVFMSFIEEIRSKGGDIKLTSMKNKVFSVFDLLGFPMLFDIDNEEEVSLSKFIKVSQEK